MASISPNAIWLDINLNYGVDIYPELVSDLRAINNSLQAIFTTMVGTRPFLREYGSYLPHFLFQPIDRITEDQIKVSLIESVKRWEPRIKPLFDQTLVEALPEEAAYNIRFSYIVPSLQRQASFQFVARRLS
jgi:phage baseplate assembly protein W